MTTKEDCSLVTLVQIIDKMPTLQPISCHQLSQLHHLVLEYFLY